MCQLLNSSQEPEKKIAAKAKKALKDALYCKFVFLARFPVTSSTASRAILSGEGSSEWIPAVAEGCTPAAVAVMPVTEKACRIKYY